MKNCAVKRSSGEKRNGDVGTGNGNIFAKKNASAKRNVSAKESVNVSASVRDAKGKSTRKSGTVDVAETTVTTTADGGDGTAVAKSGRVGSDGTWRRWLASCERKRPPLSANGGEKRRRTAGDGVRRRRRGSGGEVVVGPGEWSSGRRARTRRDPQGRLRPRPAHHLKRRSRPYRMTAKVKRQG